MTDNGSHIAAPQAVELGGKTYLISMLTIADLRELETYVRNEAVDSVLPTVERLGKTLPEIALKMLADAQAEKDSRRIGTGAFNKAIQSIGAICYVLWLSARKRQPELTKEACDELVSVDAFPKVTAILFELLGMTKKDDGSPPLEQTGK